MEINKEIIQRYHLGLCSPKEIAAVEAWLDSEQAEMTFLDESELQELENTGWEKIAGQHAIDPVIRQSVPVRSLQLYRVNWLIACCTVIILGFATAYLFFNSNPGGKTQQDIAQLPYKNIRTKKGEKLQVTLPDGTKVWVNAESSLRFPASFAPDRRSVSFTGEAYFAVAKDPKKPFIISSNRVKVLVLGTRFNLRDYAGENHSSVVVEEGKVRFSGLNGIKNLQLTANQKGTYTANSNPELALHKVYSSRKYLGWKDNKLVLDNLSLDELVPVLERWYGVNIVVGNRKLGNLRYTGSFDNPSLKVVMESICFALKTHYQQKENTWIISK